MHPKDLPNKCLRNSPSLKAKMLHQRRPRKPWSTRRLAERMIGPRESRWQITICTERTQLSVVILVLYASLTTYKRFMTRMTIQVAVAAAEKLPLGQSTAGTRKQYMWVVPSTFQVKTKKPPKLEDLFFLSHFFSLSLSLSFFSVSSIQHRIS